MLLRRLSSFFTFFLILLTLTNHASHSAEGEDIDKGISITTQPQYAVVTAGQAATFTVTARGKSTLSYQWQKKEFGADADWAAVSTGTGGNTDTYTTPPTTDSDDENVYRVVVSNSFGRTISQTATLTVAVNLVEVTISPETADLASGTTQDFIGAFIWGGENTDVDWSIQEGAAGGSITDEGVYTAPLAPGIYHVVATAQEEPSMAAVATVGVAGRTTLIEKTVLPSSSSQSVAADGGKISLIIPGNLLTEAVTVKIEKLSGLPSSSDGYTLTSPWYRVTVDGEAPPMGTTLLFRNVPRSTADAEAVAVTYKSPYIYTVPSAYRSGAIETTAIYNAESSHYFATALKSNLMSTSDSASRYSAAAFAPVPLRRYLHETAHFKIYYYFGGVDAIPVLPDYVPENNNDPAVPDFVEDTGIFLERAYNQYVDQWGLRTPFTSARKGLVYIGNYDASQYSGLSENIYVSTSFNSKVELGPNWRAVNGQDRMLLQWELAHEFFHAVENRYRTSIGMNQVLWLTEGLAEYAAHMVTPDSQKLMDVQLVNFGNWLNYQYWNSFAGDLMKYTSGGFLDYAAAHRTPAVLVIDRRFMANEYTAAYTEASALDDLLRRHSNLTQRFVEWVRYFYFNNDSPLAKTYFPTTRNKPKSAYQFRNNGDMGCPTFNNRHPYETDTQGSRTFTLTGGYGGLMPWTADYGAVFPNTNSGLPTDDKVWKFDVEMRTDLNPGEVALLFFGKNGQITGPGEDMPAKGTKRRVELGRTQAADSFYMLVVNPNPTTAPLTAHQAQVTALPVIDSIAPASGRINSTVIIDGTGFGTQQPPSTVTFNGTVASVASWSNKSISVKVPAEATTGDVMVEVNGVQSNGKPFTVEHTDLTGNWNCMSSSCSIVQNGNDLVFTIHRGSCCVSTGRFTGLDTIEADNWPVNGRPQQGTVMQDGNFIQWYDSYWIRR